MLVDDALPAVAGVLFVMAFTTTRRSQPLDNEGTRP